MEDESGKQQPHFEIEKLSADDMVAECRQKENRLPMPAGPSFQADLLMASSCSSRNKYVYSGRSRIKAYLKDILS